MFSTHNIVMLNQYFLTNNYNDDTLIKNDKLLGNFIYIYIDKLYKNERIENIT
jgi:hypothetical protein